MVAIRKGCPHTKSRVNEQIETTNNPMIDRKKFFSGVRSSPFNNRMNQGQVEGCNAILAEWERRGLTDLRWLAYILATVFWECDRTMLPIREVGKGKGRAYGKFDPVTGQTYYGRGYVQLTWRRNYEAMGKLLGVDLVNAPDRALDPKIASQILFEGMIRGTFTTRKLADYFNSKITDWVNARRIINGTDRASVIAGYAKMFYADLVSAS